MSKTSPSDFIRFLMQDEKALDAVKSMGTDFAAIAGFAQKAGYHVTVEDLSSGVPLAEEDLEGIAGGKKEFFASSEQVGGFLSF